MKKKILCILLLSSFVLGSAGLAAVLILNSHVTATAKARLLAPEEAAALSDVDCILVLGCLVHDSGRPSDMLEDRLRRGVELYHAKAAPRLLMSGDHGRETYNEVAAMKQYALDEGVPSADIFMDHAGFSTYDSIYRAKEVFGADRILIVTQEYHLYRALYVAEALGVEAYGVSSDYRTYFGQSYRDFREVLARVKDFGMTVFRPEPTFLGEAISLTGSGDATNDGSEVWA